MESISFLEDENDGYSIQASFLPRTKPTRFMLFAVLRKNGRAVKENKVLDIPYTESDSGRVVRLTKLLFDICQFFNWAGTEDEFIAVGSAFGKLANSLNLDFSGFSLSFEDPVPVVASIANSSDSLVFKNGKTEIVWEPGNTLEEFEDG